MKIDLVRVSVPFLQRIRHWFSLSLLITLASAPTAFAATETWTIGIGTADWSTAANWTGTNLPPISGDSLIFGNTAGTTTLNNDLTINTTGSALGTVTFNADAPAYTIGGNAIVGSLGGFVVNSASNITQTININFTAHQNAVAVSGAGNITFGGTLTKGGTWNPYFQMNGTGVLTLNGAGNLNTAGGTNSLEANSGTVILAKTTAGGFNVGLRINGGIVKLGYAEQLRAGQALTINGGTLDLNGFDSALGGNGTIVPDGTSNSANHTGGSSQLTGLGGRVTNNAAGTGTNWLVITQNGGQMASYGGTITDGATAKVGLSVMANYNQAAFQALSGNNTYSGGTFIQHFYTGSGGRAEILSISNVASIGAAGFRNLTFKGAAASADVVLQLTGTAVTNSNQFDGMTFTSGLGAGIDVADPNNTFTLGKNAAGTDIAFTGGGVFEKLGAGTLVITGSLGYTGGTYLGGGTLKIDAQAGGALASTSAPVFAGGNLYLLGKTSGTTTQTLGNVSLAQLNNYTGSGGASMITVDGNGGAGTTLALGTLPNSTSAGYTLNIKTLTGGQVSTTTTSTTNGLVGNGRILYTDASGATDFASIPGSGTRYIQAATYTAGLPTSGSNLNTNYSQADNASVTASESVNALKLTTSTTGQSLAITSTETLSLKTGGLLFTGANDYSITGGTLKSINSATTPDLIVHQYGTGALTIGSVIANGGTGASTLTKAGNGTLVLSGANTYGGQTYVTGGFLSISSDSNLNGANGTFTGITSATNSTSVTSNASALPAGFGVGSTILGRTVTAVSGTSGAYTITLNGNANTAFTANSGVASWAHAPALNLYSGGVLRADGTFSLQEVGTGGSGGAATATANRSITIGNSGGGFDVTTGNTLTITGNINATGMMTKSGTGTLTLSAANNLTGGLTIHDGTVKLNATNSLTNSNSSTATSNLIFGSGSTARLQLNNFDAAVTSLVSSNANAIVENGATGTKTLTVVNGADNTFAGILQNGSAGVLALTKSGGGTLTLTNASNTFTGGLTIYNGTLEGTQTGTLGTGTITLADGTLKAAGTFTNAINVRTNFSNNSAYTTTYLNNTIDTSGGNASFSGVLSGSGALNKTGANTLTLSNAANTHTGDIAISAGTLQIGTGGRLNSGAYAGNITNNGTFQYSSSAAQTLSGVISGSGALIKDTNTSTLTLSGNNTYTGGTTVTTGTLALSGSGTLGASSSAVTVNGGTLNLGGLSVTNSGLSFNSGTIQSGTIDIGSATALISGGTLAGSGNITSNAVTISNSPTLSGTFNVGSGGITLDTSANSSQVNLNANLTANQTWNMTNTANGNTGRINLGTLVTNGNTLSIQPGIGIGNRIFDVKADNTFGTEVTFGAIPSFYINANVTINGTNNSMSSISFFTAGKTLNFVSMGNTGGNSSIGTGSINYNNSLTVNYTGSTFSSNKGLSSGATTGPSTFNVTTAGQTLSLSGNLTTTAATTAAGWAFGGDGNLALSGVISNSTGSGTPAVTVAKNGTGTLALTGNNTYTGTTSVSGGSLQVGSSGAGTTGTGAVTVQSGSTILGSGIVRGTSFTADSGSTLQAGDSTAASSFGTLNFTPASSGGTLSLQGSIILGIGTANNLGSIDALFGGNNVGSAGYIAYVNDVSRSLGLGAGGHDLLSFDNPAGGGGATLNFLTTTGSLQVLGSGFTAEKGQIFNLIDWGNLVATSFTGFSLGSNYRDGSGDNGSSFDLPTLTGGLLWDVSQFTTSGIIIVVPEPERALLMMLGLVCLVTRRRSGLHGLRHSDDQESVLDAQTRET